MDVEALARVVNAGDERAIEAELRRQGWRPPKVEPPLARLREALLANVVVVGDHWLWQGTKTRDGYGRYRGKSAHRTAYEVFVGPIPPGMVLDHYVFGCPRHCIQPRHLDPCPPGANTQRAIERGQQSPSQRVHYGAKRYCKRGHELGGQNLYRDPHGKRFCKACRAMHQTKYRARRRR